MSQQINLFNPVLLKQEKQFSAKAMAKALAVIAVAFVAFSAYSTNRFKAVGFSGASTTAELKSVQTILTKAVEASKPVEPDAALVDEVRRVQANLGTHQTVLDFMLKGEFGNTQGYSEYFRAFARHASSELWLTGFAIEGAGSAIHISGRAHRPAFIPAYITSLKQEQVFRGKSFAALEMRDVVSKDAEKAAGGVQGSDVEFKLSSRAPAGSAETMR